MSQSDPHKRLRRDPPHAAELDPAAHSYRASSSRWQSLGYAISGCAYMLRYQKNTRIMSIASIAVWGTGTWLGIDASSWAMLGLATALVWITEFVNGAIEATVNLTSQTFHPLAKAAKDVAAGAVLISAISAAVIGALILGPPLLERLQAIYI